MFRLLNEEAKKNGVSLLKPFVLYAFRHTFLTRLAANGCDPWTLARIAGWRTSAYRSATYIRPRRQT